MVAEVDVLLRVEHLEQRRRGIAPEIGPELVDLVEHEDGVADTRLLEPLDDAPGQRSHVRAPVASDLGLVAHAAQRDAHELAPHGARDRAAERGLADAGRPGEAENRAARVAAQLAHAEVLEDAILDAAEVGVVLVEDRLRIGEVEAIRRFVRPGELHHPVEVAAQHVGLGPVRVHALEALHLAHGLGERLLRHPHLLDLDAVLLRLLDTRVRLAELRLDGTQLLPQVGLALPAAHLFLGLALDLGLDAGYLELPAQQHVHTPQARQGIDDLEQLLGFGDPQPQVRGHEISQASHLLDVGRDREHLGREVLEGQQLLHPPAHGADQRLRLHAPAGLFVHRQGAYAHPAGPLVLDESIDACLGKALHQHLHAAVAHAQDAHHHRHGAHAVEVVGLRGLDVALPLRHEQQEPVAGQRVFDRGDRALASHEERQHHVGKYHQLS